MAARRVRLDGLARDADTFEPVSGLAPLHPRNNTFPGEVFLHLAGDALNWCTAGCAVGDGQYLGRLGYQADQLLDRGLASNVERRVDSAGGRRYSTRSSDGSGCSPRYSTQARFTHG
jgi:hypothetical protein